MTTCNTCSSSISDPAEEWPDGNGGTICQECRETLSGRMWWEVVIPLDRADALGASGTAAWEVKP
jgi:hypothetical protein